MKCVLYAYFDENIDFFSIIWIFYDFFFVKKLKFFKSQIVWEKVFK